MNEFVLSNNTINIPSPPVVCIGCGVTKTVSVTDVISYAVCYSLGDVVGDIDIDYSFGLIEAGKTITINGVYNGISSSTGPVDVSGQLVIDKSLVQEQNLDLTIVTTSTSPIPITFTVSCPAAETITIVLVHLSSGSDSGLSVHDEYRWADSGFVSPLHSEQVIFSSGTFPVVSLYRTIVGLQGGGVIPTNASVVTMLSNKIPNDTYNFDTSQDNFQYLRTNTLYNNTPNDIAALLAATTVASPIVIPTNGNTAYSADFNMPNSGDYLYLLWDYKTTTSMDLCFGVNAQIACCDCGAPGNIFYELYDCITNISWIVEDTYGAFQVGDVVQYKQGLGGSQGTLVNCGEIVRTSTLAANATLFSSTARLCGDTVNCNYTP
jgi:hypothetical protein